VFLLCLALSACGRTHVGATSTLSNETPNSTLDQQARINSTVLPTSWWFNSILATTQGPLLSGIVAGTAGHSSCVVASVGTGLQVTGIENVNCDSPKLQGEAVAPVVTPIPQSNNATLSIATLDQTTQTVVVGPPVMTFGSGSDTRATWTYASDGSLWVYDVDTTTGPEAIEVSPSGQVETKASTPQLYRPELAANDEGLWLGNSPEGGCGSQGCPDALYRVAPGSSSALDVLPGNTKTVFWMVGSGARLWLGIGPVFNEQQIWRLDGPDAHLAFTAPDRFGLETAVSGAPTTSVVGGPLPGLWTVTVVPLPVEQPGHPVSATSNQVVIRIDPNTGDEHLVAVLQDIPTSPAVGITGPQLAFSNGWLYVLEPPFHANGYLGYTTIYQVMEKNCPHAKVCHGS